MKTIYAACAAIAIAAAPAAATSYTIQFDGDDGESSTWVFDDAAMTATDSEGVSTAYTWDEETRTVCGEMPEVGEVCATFEAIMEAEGDTTGFTSSDGGSGTATMVAIEGAPEAEGAADE